MLTAIAARSSGKTMGIPTTVIDGARYMAKSPAKTRFLPRIMLSERQTAPNGDIPGICAIRNGEAARLTLTAAQKYRHRAHRAAIFPAMKSSRLSAPERISAAPYQRLTRFAPRKRASSSASRRNSRRHYAQQFQGDTTPYEAFPQ